jgi:hypothetical protein
MLEKESRRISSHRRSWKKIVESRSGSSVELSKNLDEFKGDG